ncbi:MAG: RNA 2',3'-cyclic phosphodiesterase [Desulfobacterales bacterium]|jgi:2'-5' RNA ligase|nr:RNA 2',3'-cyclic phosphodiesterase [Desulfobacterales bacterium]
MPDTIRTFIAFKLPKNIISSISEIQNRFKSYAFKARWVNPANIHLTLKFLGDINYTDIEKVSEAIINAVNSHTPVSLAVKGAGVFPGIKRPRVIWVGLTGEIEKLVGIQNDIEENLEELGFPREKRPFRGHLTLGRIKGKINPKKLLDAIKKFEKFESELFTADKIFLFKSDLKSTGSVYTELMGKRLSG